MRIRENARKIMLIDSKRNYLFLTILFTGKDPGIYLANFEKFDIKI